MMKQAMTAIQYSTDSIALQEIFLVEPGKFNILKEVIVHVEQLRHLKHAVGIIKPPLKPNTKKSFPLGGGLFLHIMGEVVNISSSLSNNAFHGVGDHLFIHPIKYGIQMTTDELTMLLEWAVVQFGLVDGEVPENFFCKLCNIPFTQKKNLNEHNMSIHLGVRYPCPECGVNLATRSNVQRHLRKVHQLCSSV